MSDNPVPPAPFPPVGEGKRGTEGYLGYLLRQAATAYRQRVEKALADLGVTAPQFTVLTMLHAYPGLSGADLARTALVTPQTVSVILANLERAGLITRTPHAQHGRILMAALSPAGERLLALARARVHALDPVLKDDLSAPEEAVVRRWLARVAQMPG
ncbi:MarR family winged helix-turn-helix transcriptional regulator [Xanthobacter agilis]|uniref:DNA-binding MarR family transcriptional regulator n=1 Tax=Xanthobacter agilis TaxID=47492 RepID=A0ABU0LEG7_XANAG|nr:MarR family transcriptional regulator [Xanthobacter agilis]MDQ0505487.1 DNA-binding MarR family transcriptional regulator [Xanthobacter agilis]